MTSSRRPSSLNKSHLTRQVRANLVEADFYGFMPWIIIQRVTLPLTVFFYFHSAVVFVELFKEVFDDRDEPGLDEGVVARDNEAFE